MFCDLVGSTGLSERLDAEDLRDLLNAFQRTCRDAIALYGGHVSQYLGDGVMSYFGYPRAHEDDPVRAVRAALRIRETVSHLNGGIGRRLDAEIHVRVGLHTGSAVVGEVGPGGDHDRLAFGDTVNLAARVQALADTDSVVISATTARLVQGFAKVRSLGLQTLRGFKAPMEVFEVLGETEARSRLEAAAGAGLTPYVGRERELAALTRLWGEVVLGSQGAVLVRGEAGIGKSRLIDAFRKAAVNDFGLVLECPCSEWMQGTAFGPIIDMVERRFDQQSGTHNPIDRLGVLQASLSEHSRFGDDTLPLFASLLSLPGVDETPLARMSPAQRRTRLQAALKTWLTYSAERVPVLLLFEDLQWADSTTLEFLSLLVREGGGPRTLILCTSRPELDLPWPAAKLVTLELQPLNRAEAAALTTRAAGGRVLPPQLVFQIIDRSDGVPLYVEEITRAIIDSGGVVDRGDRYELASEPPEDLVPLASADALVSRFDRLGTSKPIAQLAAAIGREFSYPLLLATTGLPEAELAGHLRQLRKSGLVLAQGDEPASSYLFKHALIHDAVYGTLLKKDQRDAHARIYARLKTGFPDLLAIHPEVGAYHSERAGLRREAIGYHKAAGYQALSRMEAPGAARHLSRALELLDVMEDPERSRLELELLGRLQQAYVTVYGHGSLHVEQACARMLELARNHGDLTSQVLALRGLCGVRGTRLEFVEASALSLELTQLASSSNDPLLLSIALEQAANLRFYKGDFAAALQLSSEGLALFRREQDQHAGVRQSAPLNIFFQVQGSSFALCGQLDQVSSCADAWDEVIRLYRSPASPGRQGGVVNFATHSLARVSRLIFTSYSRYYLRDLGPIPALANEALALIDSERLTVWHPMARMLLGYTEGMSGGDPAAAAVEMRGCIAVYLASGARIFMSQHSCMLAELLLTAGKPEEALLALEQGHDYVRDDTERYLAAEMERLCGEAFGKLGRFEAAEESFRRAIELAGAQGAKTLRLRATVSLYRLLRSDHSREQLQEEYDSWSSGFAYPDLKDARALLDETESKLKTS